MSKLRYASVLLAVLLVGCSHPTGDPAKSRSAYLQEVAAIHRAGLPVYPVDLKKTPPPPERNAAPLYQALAALKNTIPTTTPGTDPLEPLYSRKMPTPEQLAVGRQLFTSRRDIHNAILAAVSLPDCDFQRNWALGPDLLLPEYATMRWAARRLSAESTVLLMDGKPFDAVNELVHGFQLSKHAAKDPILVAFLVSAAIDAITLAGYEKILYVEGDQPGVAEAVLKAIEKNWRPRSLAYAMRGDLVMQTVVLERFRKRGSSYFKEFSEGFEDGANITPSYLPRGGDWQGWVDDNGSFMLEASRKIIESCDLSYPEAHKKMTEAVAPIEKNTKTDMAIAQVLFPVFTQSAARRTDIHAHVNVVRVAAKLLAWKRVHGGFPDKLEQAVTPAPIDPFDLKPLRYRREGNGFVVYSIGETGKFDGGTVNVKPDAKESFFRYPRPAYLDQENKPK
jgi:hypothetical protein